jgi:hypothetical protein
VTKGESSYVGYVYTTLFYAFAISFGDFLYLFSARHFCSHKRLCPVSSTFLIRPRISSCSGGAFRHVFKAAKSLVDDEFIFKEAAYTKDHSFDFMDMEAMRMDGVIATAIQPHPLFVDTYGFCALSQFSELM